MPPHDNAAIKRNGMASLPLIGMSETVYHSVALFKVAHYPMARQLDFDAFFDRAPAVSISKLGLQLRLRRADVAPAGFSQPRQILGAGHAAVGDPHAPQRAVLRSCVEGGSKAMAALTTRKQACRVAQALLAFRRRSSFC